MFNVPEKFRVKIGQLQTDKSAGNNGAFMVHSLKLKGSLIVIASDGEGWEHVSISHHARAPTWDEMCFIKDMLWGEDDVVIQFHPAKKDYINNHPYCLHLWRPTAAQIPLPRSMMVGFKFLNRGG